MESTGLIRFEVPKRKEGRHVLPAVGRHRRVAVPAAIRTCRNQHCGSSHDKQEAETEKRFSKFNHKARRDLTELGYGNRPHTPHRSHAYR